MKKIIFLLLFYILFSQFSYSQQVSGKIISDKNNITIIKLWGTHQERGFAYGYLIGDKITDIYNNYIKHIFGPSLPVAKSIILQAKDIKIDSIYKIEAKAIIAGMDSSGTNNAGIDYLDILASNSLLDLSKLIRLKNKNIKLGCSSLLSWGASTMGTDLDMESVISRFVDWKPYPPITNNQVMVIHIPSEADEQPWLLIGFAGQMSVLSGSNKSGISAFQHQLCDFKENPRFNMKYEPIWFALRKGLEKNDFNNDGYFNTNDIRDALSANKNGYADGYIVSVLAPSSAVDDSLIALIAELAPQKPFLTFRNNSYNDNTPLDNLYTANYEIKRNNHHHYCWRYNAVNNALKNGTNISINKNWKIMRDNSHQKGINIQFMQVIPEKKILNLSLYQNNKCAYQNAPVSYNLDYLFSLDKPTKYIKTHNDLSLSYYSVPFTSTAKIILNNNKFQYITLSAYNNKGKRITTIVDKFLPAGYYQFNIQDDNYNNGIYFYKLKSPSKTIYKKIILTCIINNF